MCKHPYKFIAALLLAVLFTACTAKAETVVQMPTLAVLPSETRDPSLPPRPATITPTVTLSPIPTVPPPATSTPLPPCDMASWWTTVNPSIVQFFDTVEVAAAAPRDSLSSVLLQLRQTFRDFQRMDVPDCDKEVQGEISLGMEALANGFNGILADNSEKTTAGVFVAIAHFWAANELLKAYGISPDKRMVDFAGYGANIPLNGPTATWLGQLGEQGIIGTFDASTSTALYAEMTARRATLVVDDPVFAAKLYTQDAIWNLTLTAIYSP